jgi:hypothetical protein
VSLNNPAQLEFSALYRGNGRPKIDGGVYERRSSMSICSWSIPVLFAVAVLAIPRNLTFNTDPYSFQRYAV